MGELTADNPPATGALADGPSAGDLGVARTPDDAAVAAVRGFNRFYTNVIGLLRGRYLDTPYSLTEARLLFELAQRDTSEAADLRRTVDIDPGYLSRILARFASDGLIARQRSAADARRQVIQLTGTGRTVVARLDDRSAEQARGLLARLRDDDRRRLLEAMRVITETLTESPRPRGYLLRAPRPGDMGWVVRRNGAVYAEEFGWDSSYEALVAWIVADYVDNRDPAAEAAWIAEIDGAPAGCVFCVRENATTARLRLLLVEPWARGLGIGSRLVEEIMRFAGQAGYSHITLWTNDVLADARRIYQRAGFTLDNENRHHSFGKDLIGQNWSRALLPRSVRHRTGGVGDPVRPRAHVERSGDARQRQGEDLVGCGDARAAVDGDRRSARRADAGYGPEGGEPVPEFGRVFEGAVRVHVADRGRADRAGDVARHRVGRLCLPSVALPGPGVEQQTGLCRRLRARRVQHGQVTGCRGEVSSGRRGLGRADLEASPDPGLVAAVEHPDVFVPEVTQRPPAAGGDRGVPVVVHDDRPVLAHPGRAHRGLERGRGRQRVPPGGTG